MGIGVKNFEKSNAFFEPTWSNYVMNGMLSAAKTVKLARVIQVTVTEDTLTVEGLLLGKKSTESMASFARWLQHRQTYKH